MITKKLFGMISLGCDKNRVDTEKLLGLLKAKGCALTDDLSKAQIVIINTCAFLQSSREEAIETIIECAEYKKHNLEKIVVTGCLPQKFIGESFCYGTYFKNPRLYKSKATQICAAFIMSIIKKK